MATQPVQDFQLDVSGGQNASLKPDHIAENQFYSGINISTDDGALGPRWGNEEKTPIFNFTTQFTLPTGLKRDFDSIYKYGKYQAMIPYIVGTEHYIIIVIAGCIFFYNQTTEVVTFVPIAGGSFLNASRTRTNWSLAGRYIVIFDYPSYPVIIEGLTARRADPAKLELPVSVLGAFNQTRVFFSNAGNEYSAGDPAAFGFPDGPISATELLTPASPFFGQAFQLPTAYANELINAMGFLAQVDTSTGIGPLIIGTDKAIYSAQAQLPRDEWEANKFASVFIPDSGIAGQRAMFNVGTDLFYCSPDGQLRSASVSRDDQGKWSKNPISREVQNFLIVNHPELVRYTVISSFMNKVFMTCNPYYVKGTDIEGNPAYDVAFGGFIVLEMDNVSTLGRNAPPAWGGMWCPFRPMDFVVNNNEMYAMSKDNGVNTLWKIRPDLTYELIGPTKTIRKTKSKIYTRGYSFKSPLNNKTLNSIDLNIEEIQGDFNLVVKYKPSHGFNFTYWTEFNHFAPWRVCQGLPQTCEWNGLAPHAFRELNLGSPPDKACNPITLEELDTFRKVQLLFEVEGINWSIDEFVLNANLLQQNKTERVCQNYPPLKICLDCNTDWEIPNLCQENQEPLY